ncbi:TRM-domain-containing protein [Sporormia fimetaria CBS 119925]|uniref:tRNA (guanine(26)-N(2))-dimethyltransferase n=1 Tax=Sporormia fimetaria CBS 119925 TaxID=1340428 RepID=A0A6A6V909_9PLEO|nr:TRM-domain-containing protein [Sporormia fimetaria CBS 119925]
MSAAAAAPAQVPAEETPAGSVGIHATPKAGQNVSHTGREYTTIKEGLAYILVPRGTPTSTDPKMSKEDSQKQQVFYNPIQQFNRDLSVLAIKTFGDDLVQRRTQKHEWQRQKALRMDQKKKRKLGKGGNGQEQQEGEAQQAAKRRRTDNNGGNDEHMQDNATADVEVRAGEAPEAVAETNGEAAAPEAPIQQQYRPPFTILDALSATGLRALRYAQEIRSATSITANDLSSKATEAIKLNVQHNKLERKIKANTGNAIVHMYSFADQKGYDVIDLDPYGTAAPFIDAAIQAINHEGMLCVTCTDSAIFASHGYLEKTYSQYGGLPLKGEPCHEGGLRLLLHALASSAARYGMAIEPLLSLSIDYYIRVFVRVRKSPNDVKLLAGKTMIVYHCQSGCGSWNTQFLARNKPKTNKDGTESYKHAFAQGPSADQLCEHCGTKTHLSGPMYGGPLHNPGFVQRVLAQLDEIDEETYPTRARIQGMLHTALEEITFGVQKEGSSGQELEKLDPLIPKADPAEVESHPFFIIPSSVSKVLHCSAPPLAAMRGALRHAGFRVTMSHCKPGSIRTDAPWRAIWHVMLEWVRQRAPLKNQLKTGTAGFAIMAKATRPQGPNDEGDAAPVDVTGKKSEDCAKEGDDTAEKTAENPASKQDQSDSPTPSYLGTSFKVVFDERLGRDHDRGKYVRYQLAPRENWGPMSRAK